MMTKQHFEMFATMLKEVKDKQRRMEFCNELIKVFLKDNPRFNEVVFRKFSGC